MKTFTNCAEKKAKQFLNLLQGYTKGIRITAILILLLVGVSNAWGAENCSHTSSGDVDQRMPNYEAGYNMGTINVWFSVNGASYSQKESTSSNINQNRTITNNNITSGLKFNKFSVPVYCHNQWHSDACSQNGARIVDKSLVMYWKVSGPNGNQVNEGNMQTTTSVSLSWNNNGATGTWTSQQSEKDLLTGVTASTTANQTYTMDFWYKFQCHMYNSSGNDWGSNVNVWYPGNSQNFKYQFTIPKTTLTVSQSGANGGATISSGINKTIALNTEYSLTASEVTGYDFVNWTTSNKNITITNATSRTGAKVKFTSFASATITANYKANQYTITYKDQGGSNFSGTHESGYPTTHTYGTATTLKTASKTGYTFEGWYKESACTNKVTSLDATAYTADITLYAKWTLNATYSLNVVAGNGISQVTGSADPVTLGSTYDIKATPKTGYTFSTWTANPAANAEFADARSENTTVTVKNGSVTVTASATENMSTLTTSNQYNAGDPGYEVPTASVNSIGYETTATVTATAAGNGYTFTGWTLTNCTRTDGGADNATSITVRSSGDGKAATVVANYAEDLTSEWHLVGNGNIFPDGWNVNNNSMMKKISGKSTESIVALKVNVTTVQTYEFKIVDDNGSASDTWYGYSTGNTYLIWTATSTKNVYSGDNNANNLKFTPKVAGEYEFKVDYSGTYPAVTITYPTAYTLTYGSGAGGSGTVTANNSIKSGDLVLAGTSVSLTATPADGYDFAAWYSDQACEGDVVSSNNPYTFSINSNTTLYAKWKAQSFTLTWELDGGKITKEGTQAGYVETGTTLEAPTVEKDYYDFAGWDPTVPKTMPAANVTYTAQWTAKKYAITYKDQGDKTFSGKHENGYPTTHTYNTTTTLLGATKSGYTFAGWYRDSECAGARVERLGEDVTEAITLYAKWEVASYTINFDLEGGTGGTTTELTVPFGAQLPNITIPTKAGHLFLGYYNGDNGTGTQYYDASGKGIETMPANNLTLHAKWLNGSDCIFFYNNLGWSNVYVYFYNDADGYNYWADGYGTGANKQQKFWENNPYWEMEHGTMTQIKGTNIWYYHATYIKTNKRSKVSFANVNQSYDQTATNENSFFQNAKVVYRADLDYEKRLPMFVPHTTQSHYFSNTKSTYYNHGYWMNYPTNTGYKLHIFDKDGNKINDQLVDIPFEYSDNTIMPWSVNVSLEGAKTYAFKIQRADDTWYGNNGTMTTNSSGDAGQTAWEFTTGTNNCKITTTAPGTYVFTLKYGKDRNSNYNYLVGVEYPASVGDYRLAYKDNAHPFHPGHLLKKRAGSDIVSFFVHYNENPLIMLQQVTKINANTGAITWETLKTYALTANQPGSEGPNQAMIPGRRNADEIILHIGDEHMDGVDATGIYNFVLEQKDSEATLLNTATKYDGDFYIRTNTAAGGWGNFRQNGNKMTYTSYADNQDFNFNHYFVKWINQGTNVKFTIANDYSYCLSDTLDADDIVTTGNLPANANVRFGWNSKTNQLSRAYIAGSSNASDRFLVLEGNEYLKDINGNDLKVSGLNPNEAIFSDKQNWIYQLDVQANSNTEITLTAKYNNKVQTFFGTSKSGFGGEPIMQATNDAYHKVRMIYDFKTNNLIAAWLLNETQYPEATEVASNMLIIRENQGVANQINFSKIDNDDMTIQTAYAVMTFTKDWVTGAATRDRSEYWVSFPFDVKISDVFGFSEYGDKWIMQLYDGAERAEKGNWIDSPTFWKYITNRNYTLKAGVGYVLKLNLSKMDFPNNSTDASLFFPSQGIPTVINAEPTTITVPAHECTIERDNRNIYDSHWNLIGVPGYANLNNVNTKYTTGNQAENVSFYYAYNAAENNYEPAAAIADFKNMYAYMVQFAGTIDWKNDPQFNNIPQQLAARRNSDVELEKRTLRLEIAQGEEVADQTFVQLQQEGATPEFDMNLDLTKIINSGANIYTLAGDARIQVAGNALPIAETTIPVGVQMATAGEYTFRMPDGTEGMVVELIDYETNTRTNLLLSDYTTTLPQGICENRFALIVKPDKVATDVENIGQAAQNGEAAKKYIIDGKLYLQKGGLLYDAQGHIVR